jgi:hypothetical protein
MTLSVSVNNSAFFAHTSSGDVVSWRLLNSDECSVTIFGAKQSKQSFLACHFDGEDEGTVILRIIICCVTSHRGGGRIFNEDGVRALPPFLSTGSPRRVFIIIIIIIIIIITYCNCVLVPVFTVFLYCFVHVCLLTPWSNVPLDKLTVNFAASQEIPRIYGTRKFLTVPTKARHLSLSWADSIQSPRTPPVRLCIFILFMLLFNLVS